MGANVMHLTADKTTGRLTYRRAVPPSLRQYFNGQPREFKRSLGTADIGAPGAAARLTAARDEYDRELALARKGASGAFDALDTPTMTFLAEQHRVAALDADSASRYDTSLSPASRRELEERNENNWNGYGDGLDDPSLAVAWFGDRAVVLANAKGLHVNRDAPTFHQLCGMLLEAHISALGTIVERDRGRLAPTPLPPQPPVPVAKTVTMDPNASLMSLFEGYAAEKQLRPGTISQWRAVVAHLIKFLGHDDAARITSRDVLNWKDALRVEPSARGEPRSARTIKNTYIAAIKAVLRWAEDNQKVASNVAAKVTIRVPNAVISRDRGFTDREAAMILRATTVPPHGNISPEHGLALRWVPWLLAYTGARVNEVGQLRKQDVSQVGGIWAITIAPEAGTVKTNEARTVPLPPHLIAQGFVDMVVARKPGPMFYEPSRQRKAGADSRHRKKVGERLAAWVRDVVGISDQGVAPNHGWRHRFKTVARDCHMDPRACDVVQGHAPRTQGESYGTYSLVSLGAEIAKLPDFEL